MKTRLGRIVAGLWAVALTVGCGVEVGNPNGEKPKTGMIQVFFAKVTSLDAESVGVSLEAAELRTSATATVASLNQVNTNIELLATADDSDVLGASGTEVDVGTYDQLVISFAADPIRVRSKGGGDEIVPFEGDSRALVLDGTYAVEEGKTSEFTIDLDAARSIVSGDGPGGRVFRPRGDLHGRGDRPPFEGTTGLADAQWACAYLYAPQQPAKQHPDAGPGANEPNPPPPPPGVSMEPRPSYDSAADVVKDETAACVNAFDRAPVVDGKYRFHRLRPGTYDFRVFDADGKFEDGPNGTKVEAPPPPPPPPHGLRSR